MLKFTLEVEEKLAEGWSLHGDPIVVNEADNFLDGGEPAVEYTTWYYQAMTKQN